MRVWTRQWKYSASRSNRCLNQQKPHAHGAFAFLGFGGFVKTLESQSARAKWFAVLSVALSAFFFVTTEFLPIGLLPQIAADTGVSIGTAGLIVTMPGLIGAFSAPLVLLIAGQMDRRFLLIGLMVTMVVANLASGLCEHFALLLIARGLFGAGLGGFWMLAIATSGRLVPENPAKAMSVVFTGISMATIIGVPAGVYIGESTSWLISFLLMACLASLAILGLFALLPSLPSKEKIRAKRLLNLFSRREIKVGFVMSALVFGGHFGAYAYISPFLLHNNYFQPSEIAGVLLVYGLAGFVGNFVTANWVGKNLDQAFMRILFLLAVAIIGLVISIGTPWLSILFAAVWGFAFGGAPVCLSVWMSNAASDAPEAGTAIMISTFQTAIAVGTVAGGYAFDSLGASAALLVGGGLVLASLIFFMVQSFLQPVERFDIGA
jgi:predicted MFS family arabinose efflux permease